MVAQTGPRLVADLLAGASRAAGELDDGPNSSSLQVCEQVRDQDSVMEFVLDQLRTGLRPGSSCLDVSR